MNLLVVSGSARHNSQSEKVASYILGRLTEMPHVHAELFKLEGNPLPLWNESFPNGPEWEKAWAPVAAQIKKADAFVFVVPEWHGMAPPNFKNLLFLSGHLLAHKPALLTTVSSGMGGAYVISELRSSSYKNTFVNYLPEHLVLRNISTLLNPGPAEGQIDKEVRERVDYSLRVLVGYGEALKKLRSQPELELGKYPNGM